jgi:hypothetical protein
VPWVTALEGEGSEVRRRGKVSIFQGHSLNFGFGKLSFDDIQLIFKLKEWCKSQLSFFYLSTVTELFDLNRTVYLSSSLKPPLLFYRHCRYIRSPPPMTLVEVYK